jgi:two-component system chemotaxis response regulator CheB
MVVDDSAVVRGLIARALEADPGVSVVARAENGQAALTQLDHVEVDVIVLDLEMPVMDGLTALPLILARRPGVRVIVASTLTLRNARLCLDTLQAGASDYVSKPEGGGLVHAEDFHRQLLDKVRALGGATEAGARESIPRPAPRLTPPARPAHPAVIAIGGSTGAPPALVGSAPNRCRRASTSVAPRTCASPRPPTEPCRRTRSTGCSHEPGHLHTAQPSGSHPFGEGPDSR